MGVAYIVLVVFLSANHIRVPEIIYIRDDFLTHVRIFFKSNLDSNFDINSKSVSFSTGWRLITTSRHER